MSKKLERLLTQAQPHLEQGETVIAAVCGLAESQLFHQNIPRMGALAATDRRVILFVKKLGGNEFQSVSYARIGSAEAGKTVGGANFTVHSSEHSIHIRGVVGGDPAALEQAIRQRMEAAKAPQAAPSASAAEQLTQLAALLDQGLISQQEFEQQKARLLG